MEKLNRDILLSTDGLANSSLNLYPEDVKPKTRLSSILKAPRTVLQESEFNQDDGFEETKRLSKRVSFAETCHVLVFQTENKVSPAEPLTSIEILQPISSFECSNVEKSRDIEEKKINLEMDAEIPLSEDASLPDAEISQFHSSVEIFSKSTAICAAQKTYCSSPEKVKQMKPLSCIPVSGYTCKCFANDICICNEKTLSFNLKVVDERLQYPLLNALSNCSSLSLVNDETYSNKDSVYEDNLLMMISSNECKTKKPEKGDSINPDIYSNLTSSSTHNLMMNKACFNSKAVDPMGSQKFDNEVMHFSRKMHVLKESVPLLKNELCCNDNSVKQNTNISQIFQDHSSESKRKFVSNKENSFMKLYTYNIASEHNTDYSTAGHVENQDSYAEVECAKGKSVHLCCSIYQPSGKDESFGECKFLDDKTKIFFSDDMEYTCKIKDHAGETTSVGCNILTPSQELISLKNDADLNISELIFREVYGHKCDGNVTEIFPAADMELTCTQGDSNVTEIFPAADMESTCTQGDGNVTEIFPAADMESTCTQGDGNVTEIFPAADMELTCTQGDSNVMEIFPGADMESTCTQGDSNVMEIFPGADMESTCTQGDGNVTEIFSGADMESTCTQGDGNVTEIFPAADMELTCTLGADILAIPETNAVKIIDGPFAHFVQDHKYEHNVSSEVCHFCPINNFENNISLKTDCNVNNQEVSNLEEQISFEYVDIKTSNLALEDMELTCMPEVVSVGNSPDEMNCVNSENCLIDSSGKNTVIFMSDDMELTCDQRLSSVGPFRNKEISSDMSKSFNVLSVCDGNEGGQIQDIHCLNEACMTAVDPKHDCASYTMPPTNIKINKIDEVQLFATDHMDIVSSNNNSSLLQQDVPNTLRNCNSSSPSEPFCDNGSMNVTKHQSVSEEIRSSREENSSEREDYLKLVTSVPNTPSSATAVSESCNDAHLFKNCNKIFCDDMTLKDLPSDEIHDKLCCQKSSLVHFQNSEEKDHFNKTVSVGVNKNVQACSDHMNSGNGQIIRSSDILEGVTSSILCNSSSNLNSSNVNDFFIQNQSISPEFNCYSMSVSSCMLMPIITVDEDNIQATISDASSSEPTPDPHENNVDVDLTGHPVRRSGITVTKDNVSLMYKNDCESGSEKCLAPLDKKANVVNLRERILKRQFGMHNSEDICEESFNKIRILDYYPTENRVLAQFLCLKKRELLCPISLEADRCAHPISDDDKILKSWMPKKSIIKVNVDNPRNFMEFRRMCGDYGSQNFDILYMVKRAKNLKTFSVHSKCNAINITAMEINNLHTSKTKSLSTEKNLENEIEYSKIDTFQITKKQDKNTSTLASDINPNCMLPVVGSLFESEPKDCVLNICCTETPIDLNLPNCSGLISSECISFPNNQNMKYIEHEFETGEYSKSENEISYQESFGKVSIFDKGHSRKNVKYDIEIQSSDLSEKDTHCQNLNIKSEIQPFQQLSNSSFHTNSGIIKSSVKCLESKEALLLLQANQCCTKFLNLKEIQGTCDLQLNTSPSSTCSNQEMNFLTISHITSDPSEKSHSHGMVVPDLNDEVFATNRCEMKDYFTGKKNIVSVSSSFIPDCGISSFTDNNCNNSSHIMLHSRAVEGLQMQKTDAINYFYKAFPQDLKKERIAKVNEDNKGITRLILGENFEICDHDTFMQIDSTEETTFNVPLMYESIKLASEEKHCRWQIIEIRQDGAIFSFVGNTLHVNISFGLLDKDTCQKQISSVSLYFSGKRSDHDVANLPLRFFQQALDSCRFKEEYPNTSFILELLNYLSDISKRVEMLMCDIEHLSVSHGFYLKDDSKLLVEIYSWNTKTRCELMFPIDCLSYPFSVIVPVFQCLCGSLISEEKVLKTISNVKPGCYYLWKAVQAVENLLDIHID